MRRIEAGSYYTYLTEGCRLCRRGSKLVLFITGLCRENCFYCPISFERKGKDVIYANERRVKRIEDFYTELEMMDAEGVAITGGEPLLKLGRLVEYLRISKKIDLHVHIYTSIPANERLLSKIKIVDEIRFHPPELRNPERYYEPIKTAKRFGIEVGIEIPAIKFEEKIVEIVNELDVFLNVNQLEASESNWSELVKRGFQIKDYFVENPDVIKMYERANKFHYCSARFKDVAQFRRRLLRMAMNQPEFYKVTRDGTIVCCRIEGNLDEAEKILQRRGYNYSRFEDCIETSPELNRNVREDLKSKGLKLSIVERYPTANRTIIELTEI
ncbi:radical SAM protein [Archaeoglobales archaeon]|nr:MAG: radical SAM protein [Archaeoglobales archaeon]